MENGNGSFYREKYFETLDDRIADMQADIKNARDDIASLKASIKIFLLIGSAVGAFLGWIGQAVIQKFIHS